MPQLLIRAQRTCRVFPRGSPSVLDIRQAQDTVIILSPEANVPQYYVGFTDLGEAAHGLIAACVPVRMEAEALTVVRCLDLRLRGVWGDPQNVVIGRFSGVK